MKREWTLLLHHQASVVG